MPALAAPLPAIRPITDLRTHMNDVCRQATETQEPIVLTKNGTASYVLMDSEAFDRRSQAYRHFLALREAEIEEKYRPNTLSGEESDAELARIFATWGLEDEFTKAMAR